MSSGQKGTSLPTERFVSPVPKALICTICQQVFGAPTTCICGHTFCTKCIGDWLGQGKKNCPICVQDISTVPRSLSFVAQSMIDGLMIKCLFEVKGCKESMRVESLHSHETTCDFGPGTCPHNGCSNNNIKVAKATSSLKYSLLKRDQDRHQRECKWRLVDCPNGCVEVDYSPPSTTTTSKQQQQQQQKIVKLKSKDVDQHKQGQCARQKIACDLGCGELVERRNVEKHKQSECSKRRVKCSVDGCDESGVKEDRNGWKKHWGVSSFSGSAGEELLAAFQCHAECMQRTVADLKQRITTLEQTNQQQQQRITTLEHMNQQQQKRISLLEQTSHQQHQSTQELGTQLMSAQQSKLLLRTPWPPFTNAVCCVTSSDDEPEQPQPNAEADSKRFKLNIVNLSMAQDKRQPPITNRRPTWLDEPRRMAPLDDEVFKQQPLQRSECAWIRAAPSTEDEKKLRRIRGYLNKLSRENFELLATKILAEDLNTENLLEGMVDILFDQAVAGPRFVSLYADLCVRAALAITAKNQAAQDGESSSQLDFRRTLLSKCQTEFEDNTQTPIAPEQDNKLEWQKKQRMLGNVRFIGELYNRQMLPEKIMMVCTMTLFSSCANHSCEDEIEALCNLISTIGKKISVKNSGFTALWLTELTSLRDKSTISSRLKFMIDDLCELRQNNWVPRRLAKIHGASSGVSVEVKHRKTKKILGVASE